MKRTVFILITICSVNIIGSGQTDKGQLKDPVGSWKFEAPYAPEGYTSGTISVSLAEKKYSASMSFTGSDYKFQGENIKAVKDSLFFSVYVDGELVNISLKVEDGAKMSGKAVYSEGIVPLALVREPEKND